MYVLSLMISPPFEALFFDFVKWLQSIAFSSPVLYSLSSGEMNTYWLQIKVGFPSHCSAFSLRVSYTSDSYSGSGSGSMHTSYLYRGEK